MNSLESPHARIVPPVRHVERGSATSRALMGSGGVLIGTSAVIEWLGGPLVALGRLGLDAVGLQDVIFTFGAAALLVGAAVGRRASRKRQARITNSHP